MGGVLSLGSIAVCLTGTCVSTTCAVCPSSCGNSGLAKFMYALVLLVTVIISCIMLAPGVETWLNKSPFCEPMDQNSPTSEKTSDLNFEKIAEFGKNLVGQASNVVIPKLPCADAIGYLAVYRICLVVALFFGLMAVLMIRVRSSRDPRGPIQNGFWGLKFLLLFGGWIGAFFIPHGSFGPVMMWFGMIGGMAFILVQLVLIVDFAHTWAETWQENYRYCKFAKLHSYSLFCFTTWNSPLQIICRSKLVLGLAFSDRFLLHRLHCLHWPLFRILHWSSHRGLPFTRIFHQLQFDPMRHFERHFRFARYSGTPAQFRSTPSFIRFPLHHLFDLVSHV